MRRSADVLEAVRLTLADLGEATAAEVAAHAHDRYGVRIDPRFLPVYRAALLDRERGLARAAGRAAEAPPATSAAPPGDGLAAAITVVREALTAPAGLARLRRVCAAADGLLAAYGLAGWSFAYNRRTRTLGLCDYRRRKIELSEHLVNRNGQGEVLDTLLHEVAHALVGPGHGHGQAWKRKCLEVGARPKSCGAANMPAGRWRARCGGCGRSFDRHRRPKRMRGWFCRACGRERGQLLWRAHGGDGL